MSKLQKQYSMGYDILGTQSSVKQQFKGNMLTCCNSDRASGKANWKNEGYSVSACKLQKKNFFRNCLTLTFFWLIYSSTQTQSSYISNG